MRHLVVVLAAVLGLVGCATYRLANEPADLVAKGRSISALIDLGWEISEPLSPTKIAGRLDSDTASALQPAAGDEIRQVRNNAGIGYALFRGGILQDLALTTVF